jgi:hypothetical protein
MNKAHYAFLRRLRAGGRSNMYGAVPYLMGAFGIDRDHAFQVICEWLDHEAAAARGEVPPPPRRGRSHAA